MYPIECDNCGKVVCYGSGDIQFGCLCPDCWNAEQFEILLGEEPTK